MPAKQAFYSELIFWTWNLQILGLEFSNYTFLLDPENGDGEHQFWAVASILIFAFLKWVSRFPIRVKHLTFSENAINVGKYATFAAASRRKRETIFMAQLQSTWCCGLSWTFLHCWILHIIVKTNSIWLLDCLGENCV